MGGLILIQGPAPDVNSWFLDAGQELPAVCHGPLLSSRSSREPRAH